MNLNLPLLLSLYCCRGGSLEFLLRTGAQQLKAVVGYLEKEPLSPFQTPASTVKSGQNIIRLLHPLWPAEWLIAWVLQWDHSEDIDGPKSPLHRVYEPHPSMTNTCA